MTASDPTDIWAWIRADEQRLRYEGGGKLTIADGWRDFWSKFHDDYPGAELAISQAVEAARREGELRWEVLLRHWRMQLWHNDDTARALPEAIDLLHLATDDRVRDVPQRICACHDVAECYAELDVVGYQDHIVANAQHLLAQLPTHHPCANCARYHLVAVAAASGKVRETRKLIEQYLANHTRANGLGAHLAAGESFEGIAAWDDAEAAFQLAFENSLRKAPGDYLEALLGLARARAGKGDAEGATEALGLARATVQYMGSVISPYLRARRLEVEGYVAETLNKPHVALPYFTQGARQYLALSRYRHAARAALHAGELARANGLPLPEEALAAAAQAVGNMPAASRDVYHRLQALGRQPVPPTTPAHL